MISGSSGVTDFSLFLTFQRFGSGGFALASNDQWKFGVTDANFLYIKRGNEGYNFPEINLSAKNTIALIRQDSTFNVYKLSQIAGQIESKDSIQFRPETNLGSGGIYIGGNDSGLQSFTGVIDQLALLSVPVEEKTTKTLFSGFLPLSIGTGTGTYVSYKRQDWYMDGAWDPVVSGYLSGVFTGISNGISLLNLTQGIQYTGYFLTQAATSGNNVLWFYNSGAGSFYHGFSGTGVFTGIQTGYMSFLKDTNGDIYTDYTIRQYNQHAEFKRETAYSDSFIYDTGYYSGFQMNGVGLVDPNGAILRRYLETDIRKNNKLGVFDYQYSLFKVEGQPSGNVYYNGNPISGSNYSYSGGYITLSGITGKSSDYLLYNLGNTGELSISISGGNFHAKTSTLTKGGIRLHPTGYREASVFHKYYGKYINPLNMDNIYNDNWK